MFAFLLAAQVTFAGLLDEAVNPAALTKLPNPAYQSLLATSYNRESKKRGEPGWFADSDGTGYIRKDGDEYVMMEHTGPGCITKIWTPFFYYDFNERVGPKVHIYLDGKLVFDESLIKLVIGQGSVPEPWARYTARAGNCYLPIPFAKSAKVTMTKPPFYFSVNYRSYAPGTRVETFNLNLIPKKSNPFQLPQAHQAEKSLVTPTLISLPQGPHKVTELSFKAPPGSLTNLILTGTFDGEETISIPLSEFFGCTDKLHRMTTLHREVSSDGLMTCRWQMPYRQNGALRISTPDGKSVPIQIHTTVEKIRWDSRTMHFWARWRSPEIIAGTPFQDWNFVDIHGTGLYVGDTWTVVNKRPNSWWGEGDEKIYIDGDWDKGFPRQFGTGSEDYYGWAGGVYPTVEDNFSQPYLSNVIGGLDGHTQGTNILIRERGLDSISFSSRLCFDMEASFGTDMRTKEDLLGYSVATFFYALPGAKTNRQRVGPKVRTKPITVQELEAASHRS